MKPELRSEHEEGAVAVMTAILLVVLVLFAALIVDLGRLRVDRSSNQLVSDFAVTAGARAFAEGSAQAGCVEAFVYAFKNLGLDDTTYNSKLGEATAACAAQFPSTFDCAAASEVPVEVDVGNYTVAIHHPVEDASSLMEFQEQPTTDGDGDRCDRLGVAVTRVHDYLLGNVAGFDSSSTTVSAVSLIVEGEEVKEFATLILLDPTGCGVLSVGGQGGVVIENYDDDDPTNFTPGVISADSDTSRTNGNAGCSGSYAYEAGGGQNALSFICAGIEAANVPTVIATDRCVDPLDDTLRALGPNRADASLVSVNRIGPAPTALNKRLTRGIIDHDYNCYTSGPYPTYSSTKPYYPDPEIPIERCETGRGEHIAALDTAILHADLKDAILRDNTSSPPADPDGGEGYWIECQTSGGFRVWDEVEGANVDVTATAVTTRADGVDQITAAYLYVDCDTAPDLHYQDVRFMYITGGSQTADGINVSTGETFRVVPPDDVDAIVAIEEGNLTVSGGGEARLLNTTVYMRSGSVKVTANAGSGVNDSTTPWNDGVPISWTSPEEDGYDDKDVAVNCVGGILAVTSTVSIPHTSCFENLALWNNSYVDHSVTGQGSLEVFGIFFTPNAGHNAQGTGAGFSLGGSGSSTDDLTLFDAQFFTWRLTITGGNAVKMRPNPFIFSETPSNDITLIR